MFEARMQDARPLGEAIATIAGAIESPGTFTLTREGIKLVALTPLNNGLVIFNLLPPAFDSYQVDEEARITVDIRKLSSLLQRARPGDRVALRIDARTLTVIFEGRAIRTLDIPLLDTANENIEVPQLDLLATAELAAEAFADGIRDANLGSSIVALTIGAQGFRMEARGDGGSTSLDVKGDGGGLVSVQAPEEISARCSLGLLEKVAAGTGLGPTVRIGMGRDCLLRFDVGQADRMSLSFFLAPWTD